MSLVSHTEKSKEEEDEELSAVEEDRLEEEEEADKEEEVPLEIFMKKWLILRRITLHITLHYTYT